MNDDDEILITSDGPEFDCSVKFSNYQDMLLEKGKLRTLLDTHFRLDIEAKELVLETITHLTKSGYGVVFKQYIESLQETL